MWYGRRMEELEEEQLPSPRPKRRWRNWLLPVMFTFLLYAVLGVGFYFYNKPVSAPTLSAEKSTASNVSDKALLSQLSQEAKVDIVPNDAVVLSENNDANQVVAVIDDGRRQSVNLTPASVPQATATRKIYHNQSASVVAPRVQQTEPLPLEVVESPSPPKKSEPTPESQALTKAEEEAEAQNELLREAINKVKELNDGKIAKARENIIEESSPPVIAKVEKVEVAEEKQPSKEETQASDDVENE